MEGGRAPGTVPGSDRGTAGGPGSTARATGRCGPTAPPGVLAGIGSAHRPASRADRRAVDTRDEGPAKRPAVPLARHLLRVRDLIDRAYAEPLDVAALARSASVSPAYFSRSFKAAFGETPHQYLVSRRMERAKALLRAGERSVTEVCMAVGFSSLGSFSTQFRRFTGESPSAYRDRARHLELPAVPRCYPRMWARPRP